MNDVVRPQPFSPGKIALLLVGIVTVAFMGVPGVVTYQAPTGALTGVVLERGGEGLENVPVALFDADDLALLEVTHSDARGRFAFQQSPTDFHVFAHPPLDSPHVGSWAIDPPSGSEFDVELVLDRGHPVTVQVVDESGAAIEGIEVRAYQVEPFSEGTEVVVRTLTDGDGVATFTCPEHAHIGVVGTEGRFLSGWHFDQTVSFENDHFSFTLPTGNLYHGRLLGAADRPLDGILVSSWDFREERWQWNGYELTDDEGEFDLRGAVENTVFRAVDLTQNYLPSLIPARTGRRMNVVLNQGEPLAIHCASAEDEAVPSRVWVYSEEGGTWSWGSRTDRSGTLHATVSDRHAVVARPLSGSFATTAEVWDRTYDKEELELTHEVETDR